MHAAAGLALALVIASPAQAAAATGFCDDLRLMIRSLHDTPTFASVTRVRPPPALAQFRLCRANLHDFTAEVSCTLMLDSTAPAVESLAAEAARCLPAARRLDSSEARARGEAWFDFELLIIKIGQDRTASGENQARIIVSIPEG